MAGQTRNRATREHEHEHYHTHRNRRKKTEDRKIIRRPIQKQPYDQKFGHRHPTEKRHKADTTKKTTSADTFSKNGQNRFEKTNRNWTPEKTNNTTENCFVSPAVITIKKDKSVKIALDSRKLNEACVKRKATMPNMEELISKISAEITLSDGEIWMSKIDLDYAYGQAKLTAEATRHCVFSIIGGDFTGHYRFKKGFYGLSDIPSVFQEHIDKVLEFKTPVWLDDIICVTNGTIDDHEREIREVLTKLQNAGYRASERKTELFKQEINLAGLSH